MVIALVILCLLLGGGCAVLAFAWWQQRARVAVLRHQLSAAADSALDHDGDAALSEPGAVGHPVIAVEVYNPLELAAQRSRFGSALSLLTPGLTRRIVYRKVVDLMAEQLEAQGVEASVSLLEHGASRPSPEQTGRRSP